jgi:RNA polymerase sigma-70 factor (ECF subfamily)
MDLKDKQKLFVKHYSNLFDHIYRYVLTRISNQEDAEDVVAEVFYSSYKNLSDYDEEKGNLEQWLIGIAKNKIIDYWRKYQIILNLEETLLLFDTLEIDYLEKIDQKIFFDKVMAKVPKEIKALLTLRHVDGLTYEQIAQITNKEPASIRQFFSRLHRKLRLEFNHN